MVTAVAVAVSVHHTPLESRFPRVGYSCPHTRLHTGTRFARARGIIRTRHPTGAVRLDPILACPPGPTPYSLLLSLRLAHTPIPTRTPRPASAHPPDHTPGPPVLRASHLPLRSEAERGRGADPPWKPPRVAPHKYPTSPAPATSENSPSPPRPPCPNPSQPHPPSTSTALLLLLIPPLPCCHGSVGCCSCCC